MSLTRADLATETLEEGLTPVTDSLQLLAAGYVVDGSSGTGYETIFEKTVFTAVLEQVDSLLDTKVSGSLTVCVLCSTQASDLHRIRLVTGTEMPVSLTIVAGSEDVRVMHPQEFRCTCNNVKCDRNDCSTAEIMISDVTAVRLNTRKGVTLFELELWGSGQSAGRRHSSL